MTPDGVVASSPRECSSQDIGGVQCGSPLNLLKRRPDRKRVFALAFPANRDFDRSLEQALGRGRDRGLDPNPDAAAELLARRTSQGVGGFAWLTGGIGHR